jgi:glycosyltransferase involved in cell wall biosynthesis
VQDWDVTSVGVVIPAHHPAPGHLERALGSVRAQTGVEWACVVVDDGTDPPIARDAAAAGEPIRVISQPNRGVAAARNRGAGNVAGEYLAFLDQDDEWLPEKLAKQIAFMLKNDLAMCDTDFELVAPNGVPTGGFEYHEGEFVRLLESARMGLSTMIVRRDTFQQAGGFDERYEVAGDWDLQLRIASAGLKFDRVPESLCLIHLHEHNASSDYRAVYRDTMTILGRYATDSRPLVPEAADRGRRRVRDLLTYHAISMFGTTREPRHLLWAARRGPGYVVRLAVRRLAATPRRLGVRGRSRGPT